VALRAQIKRGDGVAFDAGTPEVAEEGGLVFEVVDERGRSVGKPDGPPVDAGQVLLTFGRGAVDLRRVRRGDRVWRTKSTAVHKRLEALAQRGAGGTDQAVGVAVRVSGQQGAALRVELTDARGRAGAGETAAALEPALKGGLDAGSVGKAVGLLGGTGLRVAGEIDIRRARPLAPRPLCPDPGPAHKALLPTAAGRARAVTRGRGGAQWAGRGTARLPA
jgi:putative protease